MKRNNFEKYVKIIIRMIYVYAIWQLDLFGLKIIMNIPFVYIIFHRGKNIYAMNVLKIGGF